MSSPARRSLLDRRPPLPVAAAGVVALILAAADLPIVFQPLRTARVSDFVQFYVAARLGFQRGWAAPYDTALLDRLEVAVGGHNTHAYAYPPPMAWLAAPFTAPPYPVAAAIWSLVVLALVLGSFWLVSARFGRTGQVAALVVALAFFPMAFAIALGQPTALMVAVLGFAVALLDREHDTWAGAVLGAVALKPYAGILAVPLLFLAGRRRAALVAAAVIAVLAALSWAVLGPAGVRALIANAGGYGARSGFSFGTLPELLPLPLLVPAVAAVLAGAGAAAWWARGRAPGLAVAAGATAGVMVFPHLLIYDYSLLLLAGLLLLRESPAPWVAWLLAAAFLLLEVSNLFLIWLAFPVVLPVATVLLAAIALVAREISEAPAR